MAVVFGGFPLQCLVLRILPERRLRKPKTDLLWFRIGCRMCGDRAQQVHGIKPLLIDLTGRQPGLQAPRCLFCDICPFRLPKNRLVGSLLVIDGLGGLFDPQPLLLINDALRRRLQQGGPDIHHRFVDLQVAGLGRAMADGDIVVVFKGALRIILEDPAHPDHAEGNQFGCSQGPDAGRTEDMSAFRKGPKNLLVPDGGPAFEIPIDDPDDRGPLPGRTKHVAKGRRRAIVGIQQAFCVAAR